MGKHGRAEQKQEKHAEKSARVMERTIAMPDKKPCYGKCDKCVWKDNGGCSERDGRFITDSYDYGEQMDGKDEKP